MKVNKRNEIEEWYITENPKGEIYRSLMRVLCDYSDTFYFVTRKELTYDKYVLKQFKPYIIKKYKTKEWAGTITLGPAATVYEVDANEETYQLLVQLTDNLYDWVAPSLPEDLTFIKNNFEWFYSTTHEEYAHFSFRSQFYKDLICGINGLQLEQEE